MQQLWGIQTVDESAVKVMAPQEATISHLRKELEFFFLTVMATNSEII